VALEVGVTTMRRNGAFQIRNRETTDGSPVFEGAQRTLRGTGLGQNIFKLGQLVSFALSMFGLGHSSRKKSRFKFVDTKAIHFLPIIQANGNNRKVGHKKRMLRRTRMAKLTRTVLWVILSK
jgi:hypothetical protein